MVFTVRDAVDAFFCDRCYVDGVIVD